MFMLLTSLSYFTSSLGLGIKKQSWQKKSKLDTLLLLIKVKKLKNSTTLSGAGHREYFTQTITKKGHLKPLCVYGKGGSALKVPQSCWGLLSLLGFYALSSLTRLVSVPVFQSNTTQ